MLHVKWEPLNLYPNVFMGCFYPAALKGSGVLSYSERAGGRQGRQAPLTLSRP